MYENSLEELEANSHHEHVLFGVVDVTEIERLTEGGVVQVFKHLAEAKVVVDVASLLGYLLIMMAAVYLVIKLRERRLLEKEQEMLLVLNFWSVVVFSMFSC